MSNPNLEEWLEEQFLREDQFGGGNQAAGGPPMDAPGFGSDMGQMPQANDPNITNQADKMAPDAQEEDPRHMPDVPDVTDDPQGPDMPEDNDDQDFEQWKNLFLKESVKGDTNRMLDMVHQVREHDLQPYPRKFVEDNLQILFLRQHANIDKAMTQIRKLMKQELDQNNPSVSICNHMTNILKDMPELNNIFIKLKGTLGMKGDLHRKYIASLLGAVQVGSGANKEDLIWNETEYSVRISSRYCDKWGRVDIGKWSLREDDPERYLTEPEQKRLEEGSPEEKDVLRRRVVMESIAETYKHRAFIVNVVNDDGTIYTFGWDLAGSLKAAYTEGKLVVRTIESENSEAMIDDEGAIIPFIDLKIKYAQETGDTDENGKPVLEEMEFMERIDGNLYLTAQFSTLREAASSFQGIVLKETPYTGNPSDLKVMMRCIPSAVEILMRNC